MRGAYQSALAERVFNDPVPCVPYGTYGDHNLHNTEEERLLMSEIVTIICSKRYAYMYTYIHPYVHTYIQAYITYIDTYIHVGEMGGSDI